MPNGPHRSLEQHELYTVGRVTKNEYLNFTFIVAYTYSLAYLPLWYTIFTKNNIICSLNS